jgi:AcrR family transcriptional regulator
MVQIAKEERRPRGRPQIRCDEDTERLIIDAASEEFQANGYAGTCIGAVAQRAGVSTKTLYRLIPTKEALFRSVISDRIGRLVPAMDREEDGSPDLTSALEHMLIVSSTVTFSEEGIAMNRLVIAECDRFPEIATAFHEMAILQTNRAVESWLRRQCERGLLKLDDPQAAAGILRGMMIMEPLRTALVGQRPPPDPAEIAERARQCARIFLDGCRAS